MIYFLDFEASSLEQNSFPIELAWVDQTGQGESYLIRPAPEWLDASSNPLDWSVDSERLHRIAFANLADKGVTHERVAKRALDVLARPNVRVFSDGIEYDNHWMRSLLGAAGLRSSVLIQDIRTLYGLACRPLMDLIPPENTEGRWRATQRLGNLAQEIVAAAEEQEHLRPRVHHRAVPDAESLWRTWRAIQDQIARRVAEEGEGRNAC